MCHESNRDRSAATLEQLRQPSSSSLFLGPVLAVSDEDAMDLPEGVEEMDLFYKDL